MQVKDLMIEQCKSKLDYIEKVLQNFKEEFKKDPKYSFEWGQNALKASASQFVYKAILKNLVDGGLSPTEILDVALREGLHGAKHPKFSTSTLSNLVHSYETASWCEFYSDWKNTCGE